MPRWQRMSAFANSVAGAKSQAKVSYGPIAPSKTISVCSIAPAVPCATLPPVQRAANGSTQPRPPPSVHVFDHAVAWDDYFPDVVGTALVNA